MNKVEHKVECCVIPSYILLDTELTSGEKEQLIQAALENGTGMVHESDVLAMKAAKKTKGVKSWKN